MLKEWIRIIRNAHDYSIDNQGDGVIAMDGIAPIYIGKKAPFNNFFIWADIVNATDSIMKVEYFDGKAWQEAVDVLDESVGLTQSGIVQFSPNKKYNWARVSDTSETDVGFAGLTIYDMYWLRVSFSVALDAGTTVKQFAYKFTDENELLSKDIDLNELLTSFSQTDWTRQIIAASVEVVKDMKIRQIITDECQILRFEDVFLLTAYKTLFIIYLNLGSSYKEKREEIIKLYENSFAGIYTIDKNNDAMVSRNEININSTRMTR